MIVLRGPASTWVEQERPTALAVGVFDGIHAGHRAVLGELTSRARAMGASAGVVTFDPHPLTVVAPERAPSLLTSIDHRIELLAGLGLDLTAVVPFDEATREWNPTRFVSELLAGALRARLVVVGEDFRFGRDRTGHVGLLRELGDQFGFETAVLPLVGGERPISSTSIRAMVASGDVAGAASALGRPHEIWGVVVEGDGRGRTIGVPTANVDVGDGIAVPARGVYAVTAGLDADDHRPGVANVGVRPTFGGETETVEVHLLDTDADLYGERLRVRFVARLRDEMRFDGVDALVQQIAADIGAARSILDRGD